jgi:hypothetical protein
MLNASQLFHKVGLRPAPFFVVLTALLELIAGFGLISGVYPRIGALIAATIPICGLRYVPSARPQVAMAISRHRIHVLLGYRGPLRDPPAVSWSP